MDFNNIKEICEEESWIYKKIQVNYSDSVYAEKYKIFIDQISQRLFDLDCFFAKSHENCMKYGFFSFFGIPKNKEYDFFIKILENIPDENINENKKLKLFTSSFCPHCPGVLNQIFEMIKIHKINTDVYFTDDAYEYADKYNIMSVPTLIVEIGNSEVSRWTGFINKEDVLKSVKGFSKKDYSIDYFINLLEQGKAEDLAAMMKNENILPDGFVLLFQNFKWSVRLGAIVAAEYLKELSYDLFEELLEKNYNNFKDLSSDVKGDLLYLLSLSENKEKWIRMINEILNTENDNSVIEAAYESLEELKVKKN
ncbi:MAG: thioredoxin family protein [Candidatus Muiribacteriota bacterium]